MTAPLTKCLPVFQIGASREDNYLEMERVVDRVLNDSDCLCNNCGGESGDPVDIEDRCYLHIPNKAITDNQDDISDGQRCEYARQEAENWLELERWADFFIRECGCQDIE